MKRLIYLKKLTIVRPSCFAPKNSHPQYISPLKKSRPRYISAPKNLICNRINWVNRIEEQRKLIKNNEEKNPKLLFVHVHVYA
jgi:hypothetical protein